MNKANQMKTKLYLLTILTIIYQCSFSQIYPVFGQEIKVTITGLTFDAMEPFISTDGNTLYFNSLNSGGNTNLYYATKNSDSNFTFVGLVEGTYNPSSDHLDAVASMDSANHFFWVSLRSIPNLYRGNYQAGVVNNISKVYGNFNILTSGWIIMDAAINYQGNLLYYTNAYFGPNYTECVGVPCIAKLGVAQFVNDSTFNKLSNTDAMFSNINDTNYIVYAPQATKDGLEMYFTRLLNGGYNTEICVSVRNSISENFSPPMVIYSNFGKFPEAASPSTDKQKIYYHQKNNDLVYEIYLQYRIGATEVDALTETKAIKVYPNPSHDFINIQMPLTTETTDVAIYSTFGEKLLNLSTTSSINISNFPNGIYFLIVRQNNEIWTTKFVKN